MPLSTAYDSIFARNGSGLPVPYLRSLAFKESGLNPRATANASSSSAARGVLQVVGVAREDYNRRMGTNYQPDDLWDPATNIKIASSTIAQVVAGLGRHPSKNLKKDWNNPEYVKLVTAGWNAGYSEAAGVGKVATYLESKGIPVTHDSVYQYAADAGAVPYLSDPNRRAWQRGVADLYFQQPDRGGELSTWVALGLVVAVGYYYWTTS